MKKMTIIGILVGLFVVLAYARAEAHSTVMVYAKPGFTVWSAWADNRIYREAYPWKEFRAHAAALNGIDDTEESFRRKIGVGIVFLPTLPYAGAPKASGPTKPLPPPAAATTKAERRIAALKAHVKRLAPEKTLVRETKFSSGEALASIREMAQRRINTVLALMVCITFFLIVLVPRAYRNRTASTDSVRGNPTARASGPLRLF